MTESYTAPFDTDEVYRIRGIMRDAETMAEEIVPQASNEKDVAYDAARDVLAMFIMNRAFKWMYGQRPRHGERPDPEPLIEDLKKEIPERFGSIDADLVSQVRDWLGEALNSGSVRNRDAGLALERFYNDRLRTFLRLSENAHNTAKYLRALCQQWPRTRQDRIAA